MSTGATFKIGDRVRTTTQVGTVVAIVNLRDDYQYHVRWDNVEMSWVWGSYLAPANQPSTLNHQPQP